MQTYLMQLENVGENHSEITTLFFLNTDLFSVHILLCIRLCCFHCFIYVFLLDTMVKHLQSADAFRSFSEFRQETSMLHSLQHPCIVYLVGISIHPLCFALQLAPLGSLNTVLEEKRKAKGTSGYFTAELYFHVSFPEPWTSVSFLQVPVIFPWVTC